MDHIGSGMEIILLRVLSFITELIALYETQEIERKNSTGDLLT